MTANKTIRIFFLSLLTIVFIRCVEPYEPELIDYESTLVVDGFYNNSDSPSTVVISRSFGYKEDTPEYIDNAQITIEDDQGVAITLLPMGYGSYETDPLIHKGEIGRSYRLLINIPGGSHYASGWETMLAVSPIGDVETEYQERERNNPNAKDQKGVQVFLSNEDAEHDVSFYKWEFEETYQYTLAFPPEIDAIFESNPGSGQDSIIIIPRQLLQGRICYKTEYSKSITTGSSEGLSENKISRLPFTFISNETLRLFIRYSMLLKQFSITKEYHENLRKIAEVNQTSGSLFDPIPNEIFGNIKNIDNDREPVLGYFGVGGVSEKRIFIERSDLPLKFFGSFEDRCASDTIPLDFKHLYSRVKAGNFALSKFDRIVEGPSAGTPIGYILAKPLCVFCTASDATNQAPDFW